MNKCQIWKYLQKDSSFGISTKNYHFFKDSDDIFIFTEGQVVLKL